MFKEILQKWALSIVLALLNSLSTASDAVIRDAKGRFQHVTVKSIKYKGFEISSRPVDKISSSAELDNNTLGL